MCTQVLTHLYVERELLQALQQGLLVAGNKGLHVGIDGGAHLGRLLLHLELNAGGAEEGGDDQMIRKHHRVEDGGNKVGKGC